MSTFGSKEPDDGLPPYKLCCGQRHFGALCPDGLVMCCLCFDRFPLEGLNPLPKGGHEDVCLGCTAKERRG